MEDYIDTQYQLTSTGSPFDAVADRYDEEFEASPITHWLRSRIYAHIQRRLPQGARILDLACGTGTDAIELARRGYSVVGIDSSPAMIRVAKRKAGQTKQVEFRTASYEALSRLQLGAFDLVLSNFGGLNCTHHLEAVMSQVADVARPGGYFIGVLMPPFCLWEFVSGLVHFRWGYAVRRMKKQTQATGFHGNNFAVYYHSPRYVASCFRQWFDVERVIGLNIVSPPPGAKRFTKRHPYLTAFLRWLDILVQRMPLIRSMGDHYMIVLKRKNL